MHIHECYSALRGQSRCILNRLHVFLFSLCFWLVFEKSTGELHYDLKNKTMLIRAGSTWATIFYSPANVYPVFSSQTMKYCTLILWTRTETWSNRVWGGRFQWFFLLLGIFWALWTSSHQALDLLWPNIWRQNMERKYSTWGLGMDI